MYINGIGLLQCLEILLAIIVTITAHGKASKNSWGPPWVSFALHLPGMFVV